VSSDDVMASATRSAGLIVLVPMTVRATFANATVVFWRDAVDEDGFLARSPLPLEALRDVLRMCEWNDVDDDYTAAGVWCKVCRAFVRKGLPEQHKPDCELARIIATLDAMAPGAEGRG
jgi:hypothetical protein